MTETTPKQKKKRILTDLQKRNLAEGRKLRWKKKVDFETSETETSETETSETETSETETSETETSETETFETSEIETKNNSDVNSKIKDLMEDINNIHENISNHEDENISDYDITSITTVTIEKSKAILSLVLLIYVYIRLKNIDCSYKVIDEIKSIEQYNRICEQLNKQFETLVRQSKIFNSFYKNTEHLLIVLDIIALSVILEQKIKATKNINQKQINKYEQINKHEQINEQTQNNEQNKTLLQIMGID
ncbi:MAG: hypothetical protein HF967_06500 [Methanosarcinales archaeon]|nr:hypothetical protein [Methanosarcinales archaeon]